jgi:uncharacterized Fe-S cluster-containing protein
LLEQLTQEADFKALNPKTLGFDDLWIDGILDENRETKDQQAADDFAEEMENLRADLEDYDKMCRELWQNEYMEPFREILSDLIGHLNSEEAYVYYREIIKILNNKKLPSSQGSKARGLSMEKKQTHFGDAERRKNAK